MSKKSEVRRVIRVAVLDTGLLGLAGVRRFLSHAEPPEFAVLEAPGASGDGALAGLDVVISSPFPYSLSALRKARDTGEPPGLLLLTADEEDLADVSRVAVRAVGVLPETAGDAEIAAAVRALAEGMSVGPAGLLAPLLSRWGSEPSGPAGPRLTAREIEVLRGLAAGRANKQIAGDLGISEHTVKFYTSAIYSKLGATNRAEAVAVGIRLGLLHV